MLTNKVFIAVMLAVIVSQTTKIILSMIKDKRGFALKDIIVTGGMPSSHSAAVSSLFAILILETGLSNWTIIAIVLFTIVVTDSMGVRRTAGEEAKAVNEIIKMERLKIHPLHYALGHKPIEVLAGIIIGFCVALGIWFLL